MGMGGNPYEEGDEFWYNKFDGIDVLLNSTLIADIASLITGEEVRLDMFNLDESESGIFIKLNDETMDGMHSLTMNLNTVSGTGMTVKMGVGLGIDVAEEENPVLSPQDVNDFTDISSYIDLLMSIIDPEKYPLDENQSTKTLGIGMNVMINFDSEDVDTLELGGLVENYLADMLIKAKTTGAFHDGVAARISLQGDLGALGMARKVTLKQNTLTKAFE